MNIPAPIAKLTSEGIAVVASLAAAVVTETVGSATLAHSVQDAIVSVAGAALALFVGVRAAKRQATPAVAHPAVATPVAATPAATIPAMTTEDMARELASRLHAPAQP